MHDLRFGRLVREVRVHKGLRQQDVADRAGVSRAQVSATERGLVEHVSLAAIRRIGQVLGILVSLDGWWTEGRVDQLLDQAHAALVELSLRSMGRAGWVTRVEYTFNEYGERGSVDIVGWRAVDRMLAIAEIKSRIDDVQDMNATFSRKSRLIPRVVARDEGWEPRAVLRLLVLVDTRQNRDVIRRHRATFDAIWPLGTVDMRRRIVRDDPDAGDAGGIWFVAREALGSGGIRTVARVRRPHGVRPAA